MSYKCIYACYKRRFHESGGQARWLVWVCILLSLRCGIVAHNTGIVAGILLSATLSNKHNITVHAMNDFNLISVFYFSVWYASAPRRRCKPTHVGTKLYAGSASLRQYKWPSRREVCHWDAWSAVRAFLNSDRRRFLRCRWQHRFPVDIYRNLPAFDTSKSRCISGHPY